MTALVSRSVVLVTGVSGTGMSTALAHLRRRGHRVADTDDQGWIVEAPQGAVVPLSRSTQHAAPGGVDPEHPCDISAATAT